MNDETFGRALSRALLVLRVTLGLFLLQWGVEKFVVPQNTVAIWGYFYGMNVPQALAYVFGTVEVAIAVCLFLGLFRTAVYGAALALHAVSVLVSWRQLLDPCENLDSLAIAYFNFKPFSNRLWRIKTLSHLVKASPADARNERCKTCRLKLVMKKPVRVEIFEQYFDYHVSKALRSSALYLLPVGSNTTTGERTRILRTELKALVQL